MRDCDPFPTIEHYFHTQKSYALTCEGYEKDFVRTIAMAEELGIALNVYLHIIFSPRLSEELTGLRLRPRDLYSEWALTKLRHWAMLKKPDKFSMEAAYIVHSRARINSLDIPQSDYFSSGLVPQALEDIRKRRVSILYCATQKSFRDFALRMPGDLRTEYLNGLDINYLAKQTISKRVRKAIQ